MTQQEFDTAMQKLNEERQKIMFNFYVDEQEANRTKHNTIQEVYDIYNTRMKKIRARRDEYKLEYEKQKFELRRRLAESQAIQNQ